MRKLIHQMWIGDPMPEYMEMCTFSWNHHHPSWGFIYWDESNLAELSMENRWLYDHAEEISPSAPEQFRADVARYEILNTFGGLWVDTDFEAHRPIDDLHVEPWMAYEVQGRWANNAIMGMEAGHPFLEEAIALLPESVRRHKGKANTLKSGPQFVTPIAIRHRVKIYPQAWFYPYGYRELERWNEEFPDAYAVHHWNNRRRRA